MKKILSLKGRRYVTRIGVFLIAIALIVGLVSCEGGCGGNGNGGVKYSLTMAANPPAGGNATDLTGGSPYAANTSVNIQASANPGYAFANWTSSGGGTFGNATAATTTFTMPAQNVTVTANFVLTPPTALLDHFKGYHAANTTEWLPWYNVYLEDQFGSFNATILQPWAFFNPAEKQHAGNVTPILNNTHHFTMYGINYTEMPQIRQVEVDNQFGVQNLTVWGPWALLVPTQKEGHAKPDDLDHYLLYLVQNYLYQGVWLNLTDQFGGDPEVHVEEAVFFANPVKKTVKGNVTDILNPEVHAVIYVISAAPFGTVITVDNQFGNQTLNVSYPDLLVVPSEKVVPPAPPLEHFKCYNVTGALPLGAPVYVGDQFGDWSTLVLEAEWFCNPVQKNTEPIVNYDNHLTIYNIFAVNQSWWYVEVDNQFGLQNLTVFGPVALAAPTWKLYPGNHTPPKYLDHYLLYEVWGGSAVNVTVNLDDEFPEMAIGVNVTYPRYFANPVLYKYHGGNETGVWDPEAHLLFYDISDNPEFFPEVWGANQFEEMPFSLNETGQLLAVPSVKWYYEQI